MSASAADSLSTADKIKNLAKVWAKVLLYHSAIILVWWHNYALIRRKHDLINDLVSVFPWETFVITYVAVIFIHHMIDSRKGH